MQKRIFFLIFSIMMVNSFAIEEGDYRLHLEILNIEEASSPRVYYDLIIFTYMPERPSRHVGISFEHEQYSKIHDYRVNDNGVHFALIKIPRDEEVLNYRIIVDGIWQHDPQSEENFQDIRGYTLSRYQIPPQNQILAESPVIESRDHVTFQIWAAPNKRVNIAGSFNEWDPYMTPMEETSDGYYQITLRLNQGDHHYYFLINGEKINDPRNPRHSYNIFGEEVSYISLQ